MIKEKDDNFVKISFRFHSIILDEDMIEMMWATIVDKEKGLYKLDGIPYYAPMVASGDIVFAEFDKKKTMLMYRDTVESSGNSTIQVVLMDTTQDINSIRDIFKELGCASEKINDGYFSMEVLSTIDYGIIRQKLEELAAKEIIDYAEPCLAEGHSY